MNLRDDADYRSFDTLLRQTFSGAGPHSRIYLDAAIDEDDAEHVIFDVGARRPYRTMVFPTEHEMQRVRSAYAKLIPRLQLSWPDDSIQVEITAIALLLFDIVCPQHMALFLVTIPHASTYGLRDRLVMLMEVMRVPAGNMTLPDDHTAQSRGRVVHNVLENLIEGMAFMSTLATTPDVVVERWPAPNGYGFLGEHDQPWFVDTLSWDECDSNETAACVLAMSDVEKREELLYNMLEKPPSENASVKKILSNFGIASVRRGVSMMFAPQCPLLQTIWEGMSVKEFIYSIAVFTQKRSLVTGDFLEVDGVSSSFEEGQCQRYLKAMCDMRVDRFVKGMFNYTVGDGMDVRTLSRIELETLLTDPDPFVNNEFDMEVYSIRLKGARVKLASRRRAIPAMPHDALIKTTVRQLCRLPFPDDTRHTNFNGSGVEHITGEWIQPLDLEVCDKETRERYVLAFMQWFGMHRMRFGVFTLSDYATAATLFPEVVVVV